MPPHIGLRSSPQIRSPIQSPNVRSASGITALALPSRCHARTRADPGLGLQHAAHAARPGSRRASRTLRSVQHLPLPSRSFSRGSSERVLLCRASADGAAASAGSQTASKRVAGRGCRVVGTGSAVPSRVISNEFLSQIVDTNDEWIASRTGIRNRRVLSGEETLTQLGAEACRKAMDMAGVSAADVDLVLFCTSSPDDIFGGACLVQRDLGCAKAVAFDLTAACSGFVLGLVTASRFIYGGGFQNVLVVGADALSRYVDWTDRGTCILFGDACGAVVVRATAEGEEGGLLGFDLRSDGAGSRNLHANIVTCSAPTTGAPLGAQDANGKPSLSHAGAAPHADAAPALAAAAVAVAERVQVGASGPELPGRAQPLPITMNGREVYKFAVTAVPQVLNSAMQEAGVEAGDLDWLLLHQANQRILDAVAQKMGVPQGKVLSNVGDYGNTSAASIPLALDEAVRAGKVKPGDLLGVAGFGAGLTWAGAVLRYG